MKACRTSIKLIEMAVSEKWIKQLAFYHLLKFCFNNGCIYRYKSRMGEIADQFNISNKTLYNYLKVLRSKDLVCNHAYNLKLKSIRDHRINRKKTVLLLNEEHNLFDITCLLYCKLIEGKGSRQAFAESVRRFGRGDKFNSSLCENPFQPSFSYRTIAKLLNISENKAFRVVKNLNRLEVIKTTKQKPKMLKENIPGLQYYIEDLPGYRFEIGNRLYELFGSKYNFLQFPIYLKNISLRQYKKLIKNNM
jgi:DNA-binding CsgD family transcriptional regulator